MTFIRSTEIKHNFFGNLNIKEQLIFANIIFKNQNMSIFAQINATHT